MESAPDGSAAMVGTVGPGGNSRHMSTRGPSWQGRITRTMETNRLMTIGVLSERAEVNIETIRYYERTGILPKPPRSAGGHRL